MGTFNLEQSWQVLLSDELSKPYMQDLQQFLSLRRSQGQLLYPRPDEIFRAFELTPFEDVKVVILGQDPYHGEGQAHGLCFSVRPGTKVPPSLANIFKELSFDLSLPRPSHGCLEAWARQGVLLLNTVLTVEHGSAGSHHHRGWERFTDRVIEVLNVRKEHLVFILWGTPAQKKTRAVDAQRHLILKAPHPSPLSVYRGFYGSRPFSQTNHYLSTHGLSPIDWALPDAKLEQDNLK